VVEVGELGGEGGGVGAGVGEGGVGGGQGDAQPGEGGVGGVGGQEADDGGFEQGGGGVDVGDGGAGVFEDEAGVAGGDVPVGGVDAGAAVGAAPDRDEGLGLQDPEGFAQGGPGDAELVHEDGFGGKGVAFDELAADDLAAEVGGDEFGGLGDADVAAHAGVGKQGGGRGGRRPTRTRGADAGHPGLAGPSAHLDVSRLQ
jgi:hypothetical protein